MRFWAAVIGGRSVGTLGTPMLMQVAHDRWGNINWADLFQPAIDQPKRVCGIASSCGCSCKRSGTFGDISPHSRVSARRRPNCGGSGAAQFPYAATLRAIADKGAKVFYAGDIAQVSIRCKMQRESRSFVLADFGAYRVVARPAVCAAIAGLMSVG